MPDSANPREVVLRELQRIIGFDYEAVDMQAVRKALIKFADEETRRQNFNDMNAYHQSRERKQK